MKKIVSAFFLLLTLPLFSQRGVVLIIADDLGTDYFGFYPDYVDTVDVPNIRALAKKGIRFVNATSNPVCSSTRSGILTGRYSFRTGVGGIVGGIGGSNQLDTSELSIPKILNFYNPKINKANIGKWHLHQPNPASNLLNPLKMGYNHYEGPFIGQLPSFTNWTKYNDGVFSNVKNYATSENVNNAVSWLRTQTKQPFFLWLAFNAPHEPLHLPPAGLHTYTQLSGSTQNINSNPKAYFKAMIQAMDFEIGRLCDSLKALNRFDSTDFIFIGDNGNTARTAQITDLSKAKGTVYQYGIHVPFIVSGPSVVNPGRISSALLNTTDIFATVIEMFGYSQWKQNIPSNKPVDSKSILPIIKNQSNSIRSWSFSEIFKLTTDSSDGKSMQTLNYKLIRFDYGKEEFYCLKSDPQESLNLLTQNLDTSQYNAYVYLCNQMTSLLGKGATCSNSSIANEINSSNLISITNPFISKIQILGLLENMSSELYSNTGQLIYQGKSIEQADFSYLNQGIYFLKTSNNRIFKLIKL